MKLVILYVVWAASSIRYALGQAIFALESVMTQVVGFLRGDYLQLIFTIFTVPSVIKIITYRSVGIIESETSMDDSEIVMLVIEIAMTRAFGIATNYWVTVRRTACGAPWRWKWISVVTGRPYLQR